MKPNFDHNPFIVIWELTRACMLKCLHCRADAQYRRSPGELSFGEGKDLIDQIYEMGNPLLVITGGDPLEREDLFDLIDYAAQKGVRVSMTPSATPKVTKEAIAKAKEKGLSRWAFSIDGHNKEIHDHFRGSPGSFDLTIQSIKYLHELEIPVQINTVICEHNVDYLEELADMVESLGAVLWSVFFLVPTGRGELLKPISPELHEQVMHRLYDFKQERPFDIKTTEAPFFRRVVMQRNKEARKKENVFAQGRTTRQDVLGRAPMGVNDGNGFLFISHTGDVYPSGFLPIKCGNIRAEPLADVYRHHRVFQELRSPDLYKGKCGVCEYRNICGGSRARAYAVTGDYMESEPYCTYIPKGYEGALPEVLKEETSLQ
ncbi:TIGR04053 family radical SAM/SPASM domain-containing protein [Alkalicoccus daliensis]|uniref:Radical SAM protein, BA_1875 family n=1 Tax=Alkalicoccus daliensis TaxID=745820 RepID=A0A1H0HB89_9BACI|nr:TIGR04053 family radical SAM/SPASM domain-containing protein [Alkalicoccus daliensis]SDO16398.1 radical SAM protein, BA_1875 family [Alkalicoccus daliensis]